MEAHPMVYGLSRLTDYDIYLFRGGNHWSLQDKLGAHETVEDGVPGCTLPYGPPTPRTSL